MCTRKELSSETKPKILNTEDNISIPKMSIVKSSIKICMFILLVIAVHHQVKGVIWENARSYGSYTEQSKFVLTLSLSCFLKFL